MKTNLRNYKFAVFSALVLSMIIPFAGINMAHAAQTTGDQYHIGKVADGTYNEAAALQRVKQLVSMSDEKITEKQDLEKKLASSTLSTDIESIKSQINNVQGQIDQITQEFNAIQDESLKLYYVDPALLNKYQSASDNLTNIIETQYWKGKSSFEDKKNAFPLVELGVDGKKKAIEVTLWKGIKNTPQADQYASIIRGLIPKDTPWFIDFSEYPTPAACSSRTVGTCSPSIGGLQIGVKINATADRGCTLGFDATRTSDNAVGFVTAGHCGAGLTGNDVHQPGLSTTIGTASTTVYSNGSDCDCGWVKLNAGKTISDAIFNTGTSTYTPTNVTAQSHQTMGKMEKFSGAVSGIQTGTVTKNDDMVTYNDGITINHVVKSSMVVALGDSGSPVTNSAGTSLYGVISGRNGTTNSWYSPQDRAAADLGVTVIVG